MNYSELNGANFEAQSFGPTPLQKDSILSEEQVTLNTGVGKRWSGVTETIIREKTIPCYIKGSTGGGVTPKLLV